MATKQTAKGLSKTQLKKLRPRLQLAAFEINAAQVSLAIIVDSSTPGQMQADQRAVANRLRAAANSILDVINKLEARP